MTSNGFSRTASVVAITVLTMAVDATAGTITYSTNVTGTEFVSPISGLTLNNSSGLSASLTFQPDINIATGVPSNINFGIFTLLCTPCLTDHADSAIFTAFTFDLVITDENDGATGEFVGSSTGGAVAFNSSTLIIDWLPAQIGPGASHALIGNFGTTAFEVNSTSRIVAPNSGANIGQTTVQGGVDTVSGGITSVPEPGTISLIGAGLMGLGILLRRKTRVK
jgi:hypothetical protein